MDTAKVQTFAQLLKRYRLAAGLTQEALAEQANLSARAVSDLERGVKRKPYRDTVDMLADALALAPQDRSALHASVERRRGPAPFIPPTEGSGMGHVPSGLPARWLLQLSAHAHAAVALGVAAMLIVVAAVVLSRTSSFARSTHTASPVSFTFDRLLTFNPAGQPQSTFRAGSVIFVRPIWTLQHVSGTVPITITCSLRIPGRAVPQVCPTAATIHRQDPNGVHASTLQFGVPRISSPFRLVVGIAVGTQVQHRVVTIHLGGPKPPVLSVWPIAGCSSVPAVGMRTTCTVVEFVTNDGVHALSFQASGQMVVSHLARNVRGLSYRSYPGRIVSRGSSVIWNGFQLTPGHSVHATITVSVTPPTAEIGRHAALITGTDASALDLTIRLQAHARSGMLATPGTVHARHHEG